MAENEIKDFISEVVLKKITDYGLQTALRRTLFYTKNTIDWQDFYKQIVSQMPEFNQKGIDIQ